MEIEEVFKNALSEALGEHLISIGGETVRQHLERAARLEALRKQPLLTPEEVYQLYGIPVSTLATWRSRSKGPSYTKLEGSVFYSVRQLEKWIAANEITIQR